MFTFRSVFVRVYQAFRFYGLSGILMGVGFLWPVFWLLVVPGVALFLYASLAATTWRQAIFGSFITFTLKALFAIAWFWTTYPIVWIELPLGAMELPVVGFSWLTVGAGIGLAGAVLGGALWLLRSRVQPRWWLAVLPPLWLGTEILGSFFFSIFTIGEGGTLNTVFSFGYIGYLLANHAWLLMLAQWGGVYILSLISVALGVGIWLWWGRSGQALTRKQLERIIMAGLLIAITTPFFTTLIADRMDKEKITVAIIDTTFGGEDFFSLSERDSYKREQIIEALAVALETEADYVVLPEDSRYLNPALAPERAYSFFRFEQGDPRAVVIEAGRVPYEAGAVLRVSIYDGIEKKAYGIDKQYLVPQGEFMPYLYTTTLQFLGGGKTASALEAKLKYRPGPLYEQSKLPKHLPGVLFCFASANPLAVYDLIEERELPFIVHPISHAWFHSPDSLWQQLDVMLKIHAVWNNVPIVSAGNMVEGALYTEAGAKVIGETYARGASWRVSLVSW